MIRIGQIAKDFLESGAMSSLIGLFGFVDEHTFLTKNGTLGVVFRVPGVDAECLDHSEREQIALRFEGAVRALDERFRIYQYLRNRHVLMAGSTAVPRQQYVHADFFIRDSYSAATPGSSQEEMTNGRQTRWPARRTLSTSRCISGTGAPHQWSNR